MEELDACPFCGGEAAGKWDVGARLIKCELCGVKTARFIRPNNVDMEALAFAAWNTRASGWVSVDSDQWPTEEGQYFCYDERQGWYMTCTARMDKKGNFARFRDQDGDKRFPTHWKKPQAPPK